MSSSLSCIFRPFARFASRSLPASGSAFALTCATAVLALISGASAQVCPTGAIDVPTLAHPSSIAMSDFDGNGHLDLATASITPSAFVVRHQTGPDKWRTFLAYNPSPRIRAAAGVADLEGDGAPDLFVVDRTSNTLEVRRNLGNGTFADLATYPTSVQPSDTAAIDFDLDLDLDIVVSCQSGSNQVLVFLNQGNGTFVPGAPQSVPGFANAMVTFDHDGDGDLDVVVVSTSDAYLVKNLGNGAWDTAFVTIPGAGGQDVVAADIDLDGDPDLAVLRTSNGDARIFLQAGGVYSLAASVVFGASPRALVSGDFDEDGDPDLACTQFNSSTVRVALNQGAGTFVAMPPYAVGTNPTALLTLDADRDGDLDLVAATLSATGGGNVRILHGDGTGRFSMPRYATQSSPQLLRNADLNGDGRQDMVVTHVGLASLSVHLDQGLARYDVAASYPLPAPAESVELLDFDGDLDVDVVVHPQGMTSLILLRNDGTGVLSAIPATIPVTVTSKIADVGDVDGDSDPDLVITDSNANAVSIAKLVGPGAFSNPVSYAISTSSSDAATADFDGDGDLDLGVSSTGSFVHLLENDGSGAFMVRPPISANPGTIEIESADVDVDGDRDLIAMSTNVNSGFTLLNGGSWNFFNLAWITTTAVGKFRVGDFTGDGTPDLATGSEVGHQLVIVSGTGSGAFNAYHGIPADLRPVGIVMHDLDGDGNTDFVLANRDSATLTVHLSCAVVESAICVGDGVGTVCPCGNLSAAGAKAGCANSTGAGATLRASGSRSLAHDTLVLATTSVPSTATVLYFQGPTSVNGGAGAMFGDGLRCVGGTITRLGTRPSVAGASSFPAALSKRVSQMGNVATPGVRFYQAWYRDSAAFCTAAAFNLTNGTEVIWFP